VGKAYRFLLDMRLDRGVIGKEAARAALLAWARENDVLPADSADRSTRHRALTIANQRRPALPRPRRGPHGVLDARPAVLFIAGART